MKLNKKLLVFALSIVMILGLSAFAAVAAQEPAVLTIEYQNGVVQTYGEGETIVPPAVPKDFAVVAADGKAYKYTVTGTEWQGLPVAVTEDLLGTTVKATVAGTQGSAQVFYVSEETVKGETRVVYHTVNDVDSYFSTSNTGDKGDGTNTGAFSWADMYLKTDMSSGSDSAVIASGAHSYAHMLEKTAASVVRVTLYADVETANFKVNWFGTPRVASSLIPAYLDLNGHTVTTTQTSYIDAKGLAIRIYSSEPGAHWYQTKTGFVCRANDDAAFYFGNEYHGGPYASNISFHVQGLSAPQYGFGMHVIGGKYYQTANNANGGMLNIHRRVGILSDAEFYSLAGSMPIVSKGTDTGYYKIGNGGTVTNCKFYSPSATNVVDSTNVVKLNFENCTFINVAPGGDSLPAGSYVTLKGGNVSSVSYMGNLGTAAAPIVGATCVPYAIEGLVAADGTPIAATVVCAFVNPAAALKVTAEGIDTYYTIGTPFSASAGNYIKLENGKIYGMPTYDLTGITQIADGKVVEAGEIELEVSYGTEDIAAFTYLDTKTNILYGAGYNVDCGGTAEGVGNKFHELFAAPASAYVITMYQDMKLSKAVPFGAVVEKRDEDTYNRDYFNSFANGSIVWDLNGTTVTIASKVTGLVSLKAANCSLTTSGAGPTYNGNTVFGFEGYNAVNTFTLKSSLPGGKIVNESSAHLFGVGEGAKPRIFFEGENLTIDSPKGLIMNSGELSRDYKATDIILTVNGGTYICGHATAVFAVSRGASFKNATLIGTSASVAQLIKMDGYRTGTLVLENVVFSSANVAAFAFKPVGSSNKYTAEVTNCIFRNCVPGTTAASSQLSSVTFAGVNLASSEDSLAAMYASAPEGTAKYTFNVLIPKSDGSILETEMLGYAPASSVLSVTYSGANVTKNYLVGSVYAPIPMDPAYYEIVFDLAAGTVNYPNAWAGIPAAGIVTEGGVVNAVPADNYLAIAFALCDSEGNALAYAFADDAAIGAALADALAAQAADGKLYLYQDIEASALSVTKALEILLGEHQLVLGGSFTVSAPVSIANGSIVSAAAKPFVLESSLAVSGADLYLAAATVVLSGEGTAVITDAKIFNLASASLADSTVAVTVKDARFAGVALGANVTVGGTVLGAAGTFAGCAYESGVISGVIVNNNNDKVTVLGTEYTFEYAEAATTDASKVIEVKYEFQGQIRGTQNYYFGSVANFYRQYADGYFFEYKGTDPLTANATYTCFFRADSSKLRAQLVLTDALNYTFYLKVEDAGVLANLKLNGAAIDLSTLATVTDGGVSYYAIPVAFASFADALNDFVLTVDIVQGTETLQISSSTALHDYLGELLAAGVEADAKKAYAVAEYITTLVAYFDTDFAFGDARLKNLSRVNNLLADYAEYKVSVDLPTDAPSVSSAYVKSVVLVANEKVTFAFRVANSFKGKIEINGKEVALTKPFEGYDRTYACAAVAFADLDEDITLTVKDADGKVLETMTYSLVEYIVGVAAQNEGAVGEYANALLNLSAAIG